MKYPAVIAAEESGWIDIQTLMLPPELENLDVEDIDHLADNMKARGQLQEIIVCRLDASVAVETPMYEVLAGVRRVLAARRLGWSRIRATVRDQVSEFDKADISFSENEHRSRPSPFRQAALFWKMMYEKKCTPAEFVEIMKKREPRAQDYLRILALPAELRQKFEKWGLTLEEIVLLMHLQNNAERVAMAEDYVKGGWSAHQLKDRIQESMIPNETREISATTVLIPPPTHN